MPWSAACYAGESPSDHRAGQERGQRGGAATDPAQQRKAIGAITAGGSGKADPLELLALNTCPRAR